MKTTTITKKKKKSTKNKPAKKGKTTSKTTKKPTPKSTPTKAKKPKTEVQKHVEELSVNTVPQLQDMLRKNLQKVTGKKPDLLHRIADGIVNGAIPKCPKCYGGNLTYTASSGKYTCKGFMDDDTFKRCTFVGKDSDGTVKRSPWKT